MFRIFGDWPWLHSEELRFLTTSFTLVETVLQESTILSMLLIPSLSLKYEMLNKSSILLSFVPPLRKCELQSTWGKKAVQKSSFSLGLYLKHLLKETQQYSWDPPSLPGKTNDWQKLLHSPADPIFMGSNSCRLQKFKGIEIRCFDWPHYI